ncbi:MAG: hypothetical protein Q9163_004318 [Psora crenata]
MNDPGLEEPIKETSAKLETERNEEREAQLEDEQALLNPRSFNSDIFVRSVHAEVVSSRWWFASTGFPLLAGTFGPMASAFSICALAVHWRVEIPPGHGPNEGHGNTVKDPKWLLAINGISLGLALISNFSLLLNMARRLSFSIAQPITITGWYISSFLLIGDLSGIIHVVKVPYQRRALTQAFYYAIFAAALYFIIATLMVVTVYGAWKGHYSKEFKLTMSQRTLMLQTISFMGYVVGGAAVYARIEGWMFLDALYFTNFTLLTVGIGDYTPATHLGRALLFPYAFGGIVILGLVIGSIRSLVLDRGKSKLVSRMTEKEREALLKKLLKQGDGHKITPVESKEQVERLGMSERERRKQEFNLMRMVQQRTATRQKWIALLISGGAALVVWFVGALVFYFAEYEQRWTYFQSLYFSYTTLLTIGYGDFTPFSNSGKAFFVFWSLLAVPTLTILISDMGNTVVKGIRDATLYLGEFTVLPGEASPKARIKSTASRLTGGKLVSGVFEQEPPGLLGDSGGKGDEEKGGLDGPVGRGVNQVAGQIESDELEAAQSARDTGDIFGSTIHEYHFFLAREFRNVLKHLNQSPPRKYTYDEWAYYLKLMGEDEGSSTSHRKPPIKPEYRGEEKEGPDFAQAQTEDAQINGEGKKPWSWLGERSPLMGEVEEAEWLLVRLAARLEKELRMLSDGKGGQAGNRSQNAPSSRNSGGTLDREEGEEEKTGNEK